MARSPASEQVQVNFRMPADLKARIEAAAEANSRTTTAELVATLEKEYPAPLEPSIIEMALNLLSYLKMRNPPQGALSELEDLESKILAASPIEAMRLASDLMNMVAKVMSMPSDD